MSVFKKTRRLIIVVLLLGWSFDYLFYGKAPGISLAFFILLCLAGGFFVLGSENLRPAKSSLVLLIPVITLAMMSFWRLEPLSATLTVLAAAGLMGVLAVTYLGGHWISYGMWEYGTRLASLVASFVTLGVCSAIEGVMNTFRAGSGSRWQATQRYIPAARGVLIAVPVVVILGSLLASADLVFAQRLGDAYSIIEVDSWPEYVARGIEIGLVACALAGVFFHAAVTSDDSQRAVSPLKRPFLGFLETAIVMGSVIVLFAAFVGIQFEYFFGGEANITASGFTYSEYARRGFGELLAVALLTLVLLVALSGLGRRSGRKQQMQFAGMGAAMVGLVLVIMVSAWQRMMLYEDAYGFSRLRTYTNVFIVWLAVLLVAVVVLELMGRKRFFTLATMAVAFGFVVSLNVVNIDGFIAGRNIDRAIAGSELDAAYLKSLSLDAVPNVWDVYNSPSTPEAIRSQLADVLRSYSSQKELGDRPWQSFRLSSSRARAILNEFGQSPQPAAPLTSAALEAPGPAS